jgi:hypothetical protein
VEIPHFLLLHQMAAALEDHLIQMVLTVALAVAAAVEILAAHLLEVQATLHQAVQVKGIMVEHLLAQQLQEFQAKHQVAVVVVVREQLAAILQVVEMKTGQMVVVELRHQLQVLA